MSRPVLAFSAFPAFFTALLLLSFLLSPLPAVAALNDTGQTQCYDAANAAAACTDTNTGDTAPRPRQDGRFGRDAQATAGTLIKTGGGEGGFDLTKISNVGAPLSDTAALGANPGDWACTKDNITGLIWEVKVSGGTAAATPRHVDATYTWGDSAGGDDCSLGADACNTDAYVAAVNAAGLCGHTDWRLPSRRELLSIVHYGRVTSATDPAIDPDYFPNTAAITYWSGDANAAGFVAYAWAINFRTGAVDGGSKAGSLRVRLVRGAALPAAAFVDNGDGTVTDDSTGLMWMQCSRGQSGAGCATGSATAFTWADALGQAAVANAANELGYNDWRLPSAKELESLIDVTRFNPAIDTAFFPNAPAAFYWGATTYSTNPGNAWNVAFYDGVVSAGSKASSSHQVRLVRDEQPFDLLLPAIVTPLTQTGASTTGASFSATLTAAPGAVAGTGYWLIRAAADPAPTPAELIAGTPGVAAGSGATGSGQTQAFTVTGLTSGTPYALYYAMQDSTTNNLNLISKHTFTLLGATSAAPVPALGGAALAGLALLTWVAAALGFAQRRRS